MIDPKEVHDLVESSLSRIRDHIENHDVAILTAFRDRLVNCRVGECSGRKLTHDENMQRLRELRADLLLRGYGVTNIDGAFIEGYNTPSSKEVRENSLFVVNLHDDPGFSDAIVRYSTEECQDCCLIKPRGQDAYLIGTNDGGFPPYGERHQLGGWLGGEVVQQFYSKVGDRPFQFLSTLESFGLMARGYLIHGAHRSRNRRLTEGQPQ